MLISQYKKFILCILLFLSVLIVYNLVIPRTLFGDVEQYVGVAKEFAGVNSIRIHNPHSFIYPLLISPFLKLFPYLITIKIINLIWLTLIGILLYNLTKKIKTLLIWIFSPIVWYMAIWISPILPTAFFVTLAYVLFKKWEKTDKIFSFILSAIFLGISSTLWEGIIFINLLFILIFFFKKSFKQFFLYGLIYSFIFSLRFLIDYIIFRFPFYSLARFFGAWLIIILGLNETIKSYACLFEFLWVPFIISPLLFMLYKINYKKYFREILFLVISLIIFYPMGEIRYILTIAPITILLLDYILKSKKLILFHALISLVVIFLLINSFFTGERGLFCSGVRTDEITIKEDLEEIDKDFAGETIVAGGEENSGLAGVFSVLYWGENIPEFIWANEYSLWVKNETSFTQYSFESEAKIKESRKLRIYASLDRPDLRDLDYVKYVVADKSEKIPFQFKKVKCYNKFCMYKK